MENTSKGALYDAGSLVFISAIRAKGIKIFMVHEKKEGAIPLYNHYIHAFWNEMITS